MKKEKANPLKPAFSGIRQADHMDPLLLYLLLKCRPVFAESPQASK